MCEDNSLPTEVLEAAGCFDNTTDSLPDFIVNILIAIIAIVGIISVIYVVIGGIKYIKSSGNSEEVKTAKKYHHFCINWHRRNRTGLRYRKLFDFPHW